MNIGHNSVSKMQQLIKTYPIGYTITKTPLNYTRNGIKHIFNLRFIPEKVYLQYMFVYLYP